MLPMSMGLRDPLLPARHSRARSLLPDAKRVAPTAHLGVVSLAHHVALRVADLGAGWVERVAAEALSCVFGAGEGVARRGAVGDAARRGDLANAEVDELDTGESSE